MCGAHGAKEATKSRDRVSMKTPEAQGVRGPRGHRGEATGQTVLSCTLLGPARRTSAALDAGQWGSRRSAGPRDAP